MKNLLLLLSLYSFTQNTVIAQVQTHTPVAKEIPTELTKHNHIRIDPYFWMNQRDSKPVLDYIAEENTYSNAFFEQKKPLINTFLAEFENRINPEETSAPIEIQGNTYQWRQIKDKDYKQLILIEKGKESIYFDENERAKGTEYYSLGDLSISPNNQLVAFSEDKIGRRNYTILFRDNQSDKILKDELKKTDGSVIWANDNKTVFYVKKDPTTLREYQVYKHILGTSQSKDELVFEEKDERFTVYISKTLDKSFILIHTESSTTSEISLIKSDNPSEKALCFLKREQDHLYEIDHHETGFFVLSNKNSPNRKLVFTESIPTSIESCKTLIAHDSETYLEGLEVFSTFLALQSRKMGRTEISIGNIDATNFSVISMPEEVYELGFSYNENYFAKKINYYYASFTSPSSIYQYDLASKNSQLVFQKKLIDPKFHSEDYISKRIWAIANDGEKIPVSIVYKKGTDLSKAPLLLYGYGSYGVTIPTTFSATRISLLDRGFVYAIAHIRGGKFLGENWYQDGKLNHKRNTFTDFINAAEWLAMAGYCDPNAIYAQGGSAGGLLMGAVTNMAPHLFKGIIAQVPFVDVVSTMLDESIPLTVGEYEEWGNPNIEADYWYMLSYSPYDHIRKINYPAMLITTGYHDSQVQYWEPLKWVAKLRKNNLGNQPILFDCTMTAGHGGGSGRTTERLEVAKEFAFLCHIQGINE
ncbi:S9 family peptidase [Fluviicola taffensis]|uniref:Oligopeptidase B n=1 Tax=Fluviicola taffensis (strain DSM 16823 / NCIMB 13979 / RW262) TaxID=755732 RepID=F2IBN8_FLUTR|nr:oligopeptidase B [Fluviicola taffensis]AEA45364.1 Oligopeptidase B [Fluviicola taffensis DSM 16823]